MEVQPINIQLNASTDDDSENETSYVSEKSEICHLNYTATEYLDPTLLYHDAPTSDGITDTMLQFTSEHSAAMSVKLCVDGDDEIGKVQTQSSSQIFADGVAEFIPGQYHVVRNATNEQVVPNDANIALDGTANENSSPVTSQVLSVDAPLYINTPGPTDYSMPMSYQYSWPNTFLPSFEVIENPIESESMLSVNATTYDTSYILESTPPETPVGTEYIGEYIQSASPEMPSEEPTSLSAATDPVVLPVNDSENTENQYESSSPMVYPTLYVSSAGLLTVLLRNDIAIEITLDKAIRVVNNRHRTVAATNNQGSASCIHHPAAKIFQDHNTTEAEIFWQRKVKLTTERALFSCTRSCFQLTERGMQCALPEFSELMNDMSVTILFSSHGYGPQLTSSFEELVTNATYRYYKDGAMSIWVNNIRIHQNCDDDVTITSGRKVIRASPLFGSMYIETPFIEMCVDMNWNVKITRGKYRVNASFTGMIVSDGNKECGFDENQHVFIQPSEMGRQRNGGSVPPLPPWRQGNRDSMANRGYHGNYRGYHDMSRGGPDNMSRGEDRGQYHDNRYNMNRFYYNRYQNYHNSNNHNNHRTHGSNPRGRYGKREMAHVPIKATVSYTNSSNSLDDSDSTVVADGE